MTLRSSASRLALIIPLFLVFAYGYPRLLVSFWGADNPWTNYFYMYGFGVIYTGSGLWLALASGACNLSRPTDRRWFYLIVGGFLYFASLHAVWIGLSLGIPFRGSI